MYCFRWMGREDSQVHRSKADLIQYTAYSLRLLFHCLGGTSMNTFANDWSCYIYSSLWKYAVHSSWWNNYMVLAMKTLIDVMWASLLLLPAIQCWKKNRMLQSQFENETAAKAHCQWISLMLLFTFLLEKIITGKYDIQIPRHLKNVFVRFIIHGPKGY